MKIEMGKKYRTRDGRSDCEKIDITNLGNNS